MSTTSITGTALDNVDIDDEDNVDSKRKLASIQLVSEIRDIPGADLIQMARILGWEVVVKKDQFKVGDKAVYIEIDSVVPEKPVFEFLRERKFRISTIRLRKQVSQGIAFKPEELSLDPNTPVDTDVTAIVGIKKYKSPREVRAAAKAQKRTALAKFMGIKKSGPKPFNTQIVPKTDETRIQVLSALIDKYRGQAFYVTEKLDGSSITIFNHQGQFGVCSRNFQLAGPSNTPWDQFVTKHGLRDKVMNLQAKADRALDSMRARGWGSSKGFLALAHAKRALFQQLCSVVVIDQGQDNKYWQLVNALGLPAKFEALGLKNIAIQGEMCGPSVQGNKYGFKELRLYLYQAYDTAKQRYLTLDEFTALAAKLELETVPILSRSFILNHEPKELLTLAEGKSVYNPKQEREGLVYRLADMPFDFELAKLNAGLVSFKTISPQFEIEQAKKGN